MIDGGIDVLLERGQHGIDHGRGGLRFARAVADLQDARLADDRDRQVLLEFRHAFFRGQVLEVDAVLGRQAVQGRFQHGLAEDDATIGVHVILGIAADARNIDFLGGVCLLDQHFGLGLVDPGHAAVVESAQHGGNDQGHQHDFLAVAHGADEARQRLERMGLESRFQERRFCGWFDHTAKPFPRR